MPPCRPCRLAALPYLPRTLPHTSQRLTLAPTPPPYIYPTPRSLRSFVCVVVRSFVPVMGTLLVGSPGRPHCYANCPACSVRCSLTPCPPADNTNLACCGCAFRTPYLPRLTPLTFTVFSCLNLPRLPAAARLPRGCHVCCRLPALATFCGYVTAVLRYWDNLGAAALLPRVGVDSACLPPLRAPRMRWNTRLPACGRAVVILDAVAEPPRACRRLPTPPRLTLPPVAGSAGR